MSNNSWFYSDLPLWEASLTFQFAQPVALQAMPVVTLRGLTGYALARHPSPDAPLFKPESGPQPYTYHVAPGRLLYLHDTSAPDDADICDVLHAVVTGFTAPPARMRALPEALAAYGDTGWGAGAFQTPYTLAWNESPPRAAPWSQPDETGRAAWRLVLESPAQLSAHVCGGAPDGPRQRLRIEEILDASHPVPVYFHGAEAGVHMLLHAIAMAAARRVRELARAAHAAFHFDPQALTDLIWGDTSLTRVAVEPRRNVWVHEERGKRDFSGLVGLLEIEGPAALGRLLQSATLTGIGEKVNYGCGRIAAQRIA